MTHRTDRAGRSQSAGADRSEVLGASRVLRREQSGDRAACIGWGVDAGTAGSRSDRSRTRARRLPVINTRCGSPLASRSNENAGPRRPRVGQRGAEGFTLFLTSRTSAPIDRADGRRSPCLLSTAATYQRGLTAAGDGSRARLDLPTPLPGFPPPAGRASSSAVAPCVRTLTDRAGLAGTACAERRQPHCGRRRLPSACLRTALFHLPGGGARFSFGRRLCGAVGMVRAAGSSAVSHSIGRRTVARSTNRRRLAPDAARNPRRSRPSYFAAGDPQYMKWPAVDRGPEGR